MTFVLRERGGLWRTLAKLLAVAEVGVRRRYAQLGEVAIRSGFLALTMFAFGQLWRSVTLHVAARPGGYALPQLIWYLALTESVVFTTPSNTELELDREVRSGDIAYRIARPLAYPLFHWAAACGDRWLRFAFNLAVGMGIAYLLVGPIPLRLSVMGMSIATALFSVAIDELNALGISLSSFWLENSFGMHLLYRRAMLLLGGALIPLDAYPQWLARICRALPFAQLVAAPAHLFVSRDLGGVLPLLAGQALFTACSALCVWVIYSVGVRRLTAQGG